MQLCGCHGVPWRSLSIAWCYRGELGTVDGSEIRLISWYGKNIPLFTRFFTSWLFGISEPATVWRLTSFSEFGKGWVLMANPDFNAASSGWITNSMFPYLPQSHKNPSTGWYQFFPPLLSTTRFHKIFLDKIQWTMQKQHILISCFWCDVFFSKILLGIISYHFLLPVWNCQKPRWLQSTQWLQFIDWQPAGSHPVGQVLMHRVARESQGPKQTVPYLLNGWTSIF